MAVKPITNKQVVSREGVNRGKHFSNRNLTARAGNKERTYVPGPNIVDNYSITLKDIDTSILGHVKNVMKPSLREANEVLNVPVFYGNEERWKAARKRGVLRDKNNSLILPLIMLRRTELSKDSIRQQSFKHDVNRETAYFSRINKWSKDNRYDRFSVQTNQKPVYENIITGLPENYDTTYEFIIWTNYIEQMNILVEDFIHQGNTYWGDSADRKFYATLESLSDASEMSQEGERFIKTSFSLIVKTPLLPEYFNSLVTGKISQIQKRLTPRKVVFGYEGDATVEQITGETTHQQGSVSSGPGTKPSLPLSRTKP